MAKAAKRAGAAPEEVRDLRGAIEWMKKEGDLIITEKEVNWTAAARFFLTILKASRNIARLRIYSVT